jgi:hypothetical protein
MRKLFFAALPLLFSVTVVVFASSKPEYMKLKVGDAVEVEGDWQAKAQIFVADDIEKLPEPRRPKLRGTIAQILVEEKSFVLFGMKIKVDGKTEFIDNGGQTARFENLKVKTRIEATSRIDENGTWIARKIELGKLKASDKVKGTITRIAFDGTPPDTFEVSGLKILVNEGTDLYGSWGAQTPALSPEVPSSPSADDARSERLAAKNSNRRE